MERLYASFGLDLSKLELHESAKGRTAVGYASAFDHPITGTLEEWLYGTTTFIRKGAFTKTLRENRDQIQALVNHGMDPKFGMLPVGVPTVIKQDDYGLYTETELHDGPGNADLKAALAQGALRAMSIGFEVKKETWSEDKSTREIHEVKLFEYSYVTFPANQGSFAELHSSPLAGVSFEPQTKPGHSATGAAEGTPDPSRLTWAIRTSQQLEAWTSEDERFAKRLQALKGGRDA